MLAVLEIRTGGSNFQLLIRSSLYSMCALPEESLSCYSAPGQIAEFHFISFLSSRLPGCEGHEMLLNNQGGAKLNCEDHHFVFKGVEPKHPENKFNLYRRRSSVCLCQSAGVLGDRENYITGRFLWHFAWNVHFAIFLSVK